MTPELKKVADTLLANGFRVWEPTDSYYSYLFFSIREKLGYVEHDRLAGLKWVTVHRPSARIGCGFQFECQAFSIEERAERCCECFCPGYFQSYYNDVVKWKSIDSFLKTKPHIKEMKSDILSHNREMGD